MLISTATDLHLSMLVIYLSIVIISTPYKFYLHLAYLDRKKSFDDNLNLLKKRVLSKVRLSVERQLLKKNQTMDNFLEMLKFASENVAKKSVIGKRFNTAYKVLFILNNSLDPITS